LISKETKKRFSF